MSLFCYKQENSYYLWHAIELQTMYHLIAKDKVAEQHISRKTLTAILFQL